MKRSFCCIAMFAVIVLLQGIAQANTLSNSDFSTAAAPTTLTLVRTGAPSAAPPWTVYNNTAATTRTEVLPSFGHRSGVIHVTTTGAANGLVQVWAPYNQGPSKVTNSASIYVKSGKVGLGTGNGGNTFVSSIRDADRRGMGKPCRQGDSWHNDTPFGFHGHHRQTDKVTVGLKREVQGDGQTSMRF